MSTSTSPSAAPASASTRWMWAAIGGLGLCVVALGTTLVVQNRTAGAGGAALAPVAAGAPQAQAGALPAPGAADFEQKRPVALVGKPPVATNSVANSDASPSAPGGWDNALQTQPVAQAMPPACATCGRVESVQAVQQAAPATGVGAVAGGVLGAVVGNQVGKGSGRAAATVLGAVGGGYVGHKVEERSRTQTVYQVAVRMEDGSVRRFQRAQPPAVGTPVVVQGKGFRVDEGGYAAPPQANGVRVAHQR